MEAVSVFLSLLFVSGALAVCPHEPALFVTAPKTMEALSGSCLQIPCSFTAEPTREFQTGTFGVWIKSDSRFGGSSNNVIFNGSSQVNVYQLSLTGDLTKKNCTTVFNNLTRSHSDSYFFRIESGSFRATASCDPVQINVKDSAPSPSIEMSGGELKEAESLTVTCSAPAPCPHSPPKLTWSLQQDAALEKNSDGTFTTKIRQIITLSDEHDGHNITCSARYPLNNGSWVEAAPAVRTLSVSYAPKDTLASSASAGGRVNLTCSSRAKPPASRFVWFKRSSDGVTNVSAGVVHSVGAADGGVYFCEATNDLGTGRSPEIRPTGEPLRWEALLGGVLFGIVLVVCSVVLVWRWKSTRPPAQQTQSQTEQELAAKESGSETREENIHYGQIHFSTVGAEASRDSRRQQQDTVYAQVKVSHAANGAAQAADEDLYAQVKTK